MDDGKSIIANIKKYLHTWLDILHVAQGGKASILRPENISKAYGWAWFLQNEFSKLDENDRVVVIEQVEQVDNGFKLLYIREKNSSPNDSRTCDDDQHIDVIIKDAVLYLTYSLLCNTLLSQQNFAFCLALHEENAMKLHFQPVKSSMNVIKNEIMKKGWRKKKILYNRMWHVVLTQCDFFQCFYRSDPKGMVYWSKNDCLYLYNYLLRDEVLRHRAIALCLLDKCLKFHQLKTTSAFHTNGSDIRSLDIHIRDILSNLERLIEVNQNFLEILLFMVIYLSKCQSDNVLSFTDILLEVLCSLIAKDTATRDFFQQCAIRTLAFEKNYTTMISRQFSTNSRLRTLFSEI